MTNEPQTVPAALAAHLQKQQGRAMLIGALLETTTEAVDGFDGTGECTLVLRHIGELVSGLIESLDSVNLPKAVQS